MRTEFISGETILTKVREAMNGNRVTRMAIIARSWQEGRKLLQNISQALTPRNTEETSLMYDKATVTILPGPGCLKGDFLERDNYDEMYIVPDGITLTDVHNIAKLLLGKK